MIDWFLKILFVILAYLVGSIPWGFLFGKAKGIDLRTVGSKNIGATNAGRVLGKKYAVLTYILDMLKGFIFVFLFRYKIISPEWCLINPMIYGFAASLGHIFPLYLGFKGGKSVACGSGAIAGYCPILLLVGITVFFITTIISKYVSLGSLIGSTSVLIGTVIVSIINNSFTLNLTDFPINEYWPYNFWLIFFSFLIIIFVFIRHKDNIKRLINHNENKVKWFNKK